MLHLNTYVKVCALIKTCILVTPLLVTAGTKNPTKTSNLTTTDPAQQFRANLYAEVGNDLALADGILTIYNPLYSNDVDMSDARKLTNFGENIALIRDGQTLAIEKRKPVGETDTAFLRLWQMSKRKYRLELIAVNLDHPGLYGFVEDSYLNTSTLIELNGVSTISFTIDNNPGSAAADRFKVVFSTDISQALGGIVPIHYIKLNAMELGGANSINWMVENEFSMKDYEIERSSNGRSFTTIRTAQPKSNNNSRASYSIVDKSPAMGNNFYRIKGNSINGKVQYSPVIKVLSDKSRGGMNIYPNPARNNIVNLELSNQPAGKYEVRLLNFMGQQVYTREIELNTTNDTYPLQITQNVAPGYYQLEVTGATKRMTQQVIIQ